MGGVACKPDVSAIDIFRLSANLAYIVIILHTSKSGRVKKRGPRNRLEALKSVHGDISMGEFRRVSDAAGDK